jgi:hypothetical protein
MIPLYFPENKAEYIPAAIVCILFIIGAFVTLRVFIRASNREMQQFAEMEKNINESNGVFYKHNK